MTKEELEAKVAELEKENAELQKRNEQVAALETENAELRNINTGLEKSQETLLKSNQELQVNLESKVQEIDKVMPTIKVGKDSYQVRFKKFTDNGKQYTFEDLKKDKDLQKSLIEKKSGILVKK